MIGAVHIRLSQEIRKGHAMYTPATQQRTRDAFRAAEQARADAIAEFWSRLNLFR